MSNASTERRVKRTKIERLIVGLADLCEEGKLRAAKRYRGLTLQQAWSKATADDLRSILEALKVTPPPALKCTVGCGPSCWGSAYGKTADELRKLIRGIPPKISRAYSKA